MEKIYNPDGKVALVYYQPIPKLVNISGNQVYFDCRFGVSMAFVDENIVDSLLGLVGGCCGNSRKIISLANNAQYLHWQNGNGGR